MIEQTVRRATLDDYEEVKALCGEMDPHRWLADPRNIILIEGDDCALFLWRWIGIYEAHVLFKSRGKQAINRGGLWLDMMFKSGAAMILCVISKELPQASWFARQLGFSHRGDIDTIQGLSEMYQLEASQWA